MNFNRALHTIIIPMPMDISTPKIGSNSTWSLEYRKQSNIPYIELYV